MIGTLLRSPLEHDPPTNPLYSDFYEESRWQKLRRRLIEEPLIPLGCALTCWALYEATRSMKAGDHHRTNRMFRRRIYAQGFTLVAMVAGSAYWSGDRAKRKEFDGLVDEKKKKEKHEAWIKELEIRDQEDKDMDALRKKLAQGRGAEEKRLDESRARAVETSIRSDGNGGGLRSALEPTESRTQPGVLAAAMRLWESRR